MRQPQEGVKDRVPQCGMGENRDWDNLAGRPDAPIVTGKLGDSNRVDRNLAVLALRISGVAAREPDYPVASWRLASLASARAFAWVSATSPQGSLSATMPHPAW